MIRIATIRVLIFIKLCLSSKRRPHWTPSSGDDRMIAQCDQNSESLYSRWLSLPRNSHLLPLFLHGLTNSTNAPCLQFKVSIFSTRVSWFRIIVRLLNGHFLGSKPLTSGIKLLVPMGQQTPSNLFKSHLQTLLLTTPKVLLAVDAIICNFGLQVSWENLESHS